LTCRIRRIEISDEAHLREAKHTFQAALWSNRQEDLFLPLEGALHTNEFLLSLLSGRCEAETAMWHVIRSAALVLLLLVLMDRARSDEPKVITLSCEGTLTPTYGANKPEAPQPLQKTGVVVNLDERTVFFLGYIVPIESVDGASIDFGARQTVDYGFSIGIMGHIDRASGRMAVTTTTLDPTKPNDPNIAALSYDVICESNNAF
jgi:hypothetical protein